MSDDYEALYSQIYNAPGPREQLAFFEELIRLADANNDIEVAYGARREYSSLACHEGSRKKVWWHSRGAWLSSTRITSSIQRMT